MTEAVSSNPADSVDLERLIREIRDVSTLPFLMAEVFRMLQEPETNVRQLEQVLTRDPALTTRVLRTANSAFYARARQVADLHSAIIVLGFATIRSIALAGSICNLFHNGNEVGPFNRQKLWEHCTAVAAVARMIAQRLGIADFNRAFVAGLLHDIGVILADQYLHEPFTILMHGWRQDQELLHEAEQRILAMTHMQLGERVLQSWNFPHELCEVVRWHHEPDQADADSRQLAAIVHIADFLCNLKGIGQWNEGKLLPSMTMVRELHVSKADMKIFLEDLPRALEEIEELRGFAHQQNMAS